METQKNVNLLNNTDSESSKFATIKMSLMIKITKNIEKETKMIQDDLSQKSSNQIFVIIQMQIFL